MGNTSTAQFLKSSLTVIIMVGVLGVAFGESLYRKANYMTFLAIESFPTLNLLHRDKLVSENKFEDEGGMVHRLFVFESASSDAKNTCRVVVTDENYHVTSSWNADRDEKLLNVGFMEHTSPPVIEIVRHDASKRALVCEHLCLHMGVLQAYQYKPQPGAGITK
ncbi:hypothetical protein AB1L30_22140 [Bremerella sp. JC817]|uniref:hypothetical protein n=1 Tax=Bremerella sp. JC817 TaxID=3231756 RepID=UPI00345777E0